MNYVFFLIDRWTPARLLSSMNSRIFIAASCTLELMKARSSARPKVSVNFFLSLAVESLHIFELIPIMNNNELKT